MNRDSGRGQLILVGALLVAATILSSIVLLNSIHESPETYTRHDSQSLIEAERNADQVQDDLEQAFLVNTSVDEAGTRLPYAQNDTFDSIVEEYEGQLVNLSTTDSAAIVRVDLVETQTGGIARQREVATGFKEFPSGTGSKDVIKGAESVPRMHLYVNETNVSTLNSFDVWLSESSGTGGTGEELQINEDGVSGAVTCDLSGRDFEAIEIDFVDGVGSVATDEKYCGDREFGTSLDPPLYVVFEDGDNAKGTFTVTGAGGTSVASDITGSPGDKTWSKTSTAAPEYIVNPVFEIEYRTPEVSYSSRVALYNETGQ
ncbi:MAG: hypothetical protein V5A39_06300 [Haloarculaceae archaeon]